MHMTKGANAPLETNNIRISWAAAPGRAEVDVSAYLLTSSRKVEGDDGMVFYGQTSVQGVSVSLNQADRYAIFTVQTDTLKSSIETIAFCIALDNSADPSRRLEDLQSVQVIAGELSYEIPLKGMSEQALILVEVYRRNGQFKLRAVGQGFNGGLGPLATSFGVDVEGEGESEPVQPSAPEPSPQPSTVNLTKITLEKSQRVNLRKDVGRISAKLVWEGRGAGDGDLDLYCFYVLKDGTCGKVYWKDLGRDHGAPFITLSGDSQAAGEEEIVLHRPEELRYALFAAYSAVGNGAGSFASYKPKMIFKAQDGSEVTVPLLNPVSTSYWVAITHLDIDKEISIQHIETYGKSGRAFVAAERSPRLHADGSWDVSKGKIEFKR